MESMQDWISFLLHFRVLGAFMLIFLSALVMFKALSGGQFTFVVPLSAGINFLLTILVGVYFFKDRLTLMSYVGIIMILTGILILSLNNQKYGH